MNKRLNIVGWGAYLALIYVHVRTLTFSMRLCVVWPKIGQILSKSWRTVGESYSNDCTKSME